MIREFKGSIARTENLEVMPVPNIEIKRYPGIELLAGFLANQKQPNGDNKEVMEWIALIYTRPELKDEVFNKIKKDKSFIKDPENLYETTINSLKEYGENTSQLNLDDEIRKREEMLPKYKERITKLIEYFRPNIKTSNIKNVEVIPCDGTLTKVDIGQSINLGDTIFIMSHTKNPDNFDHEFLHGIINPITEKFAEYFESDEQKKKILEFTNGGKEGYGDYSVSILNEEIIETYNKYIKDGGRPSSFLDIKKEQPILKNELRKRLLSFYKGYENNKSTNSSLSFEKYFSDNFKKVLY